MITCRSHFGSSRYICSSCPRLRARARRRTPSGARSRKMAFLPLEQSPRRDCDAGSSEEELVAGEARRAGVRRVFIAAAGLLI